MCESWKGAHGMVLAASSPSMLLQASTPPSGLGHACVAGVQGGAEGDRRGCCCQGAEAWGGAQHLARPVHLQDPGLLL